MTLRAALIGLGQIAWRHDAGQPGPDDECLTHLSAYHHRSGVSVIGGSDADVDARQLWTASTGYPAFSSVEELLSQKPDIVSICSPSAMHAQHLELCLNARVPMIWLEKPATQKPADTQRLAALSRARGTSRVLVGFQRRYLPVYNRLKSRLEASGTVHSISVIYSRGLETNGSHLLDVLFFLLGEDRTWTITDGAATNEISYGKEVSPSFIISFDNGIRCTVTGLDCGYHSVDIAAHCAAGRASVLYGGLGETWEEKIPNPAFPGYFRLDEIVIGATQKQLAAEMGSVFPQMLHDLISAFAERRDPLSNLETSMASQALVQSVLGRWR